MSQRTLHS